MKILNQGFLFLLTILMVSSCSFSKGTKAEPLIGLSYSYSGFKIDDVNLFDTDKNTPLKNKKIKIGRTLLVSIEGLTGFTVENDQISPVCEVTVTDPEGNVALHSDDLYANAAGFAANMSDFFITITMGSPIVPGKNYKTVANLYDKKNPENRIDVTVKSEVID